MEFSLARASLIHYFVEVHSFNSIGLECNAIQGQQISEWLNSSTNEKKLEDVSNPLTFAVYGSLLIWLKSYLRETGRKLDVITFLQKQSLSQLSRL
ncbi:MAG: hypothetical protein EA409_13790 [Saprospirales bacterium]|nr:MAG: hypothetical protein EA409_13790 [Saprospirales bacterium]